MKPSTYWYIAFLVCLAVVQPGFAIEPGARIIGHRGLGAGNPNVPENSIASIQQALDKGVSAIEIDVQLTSDGQVVLLHDQALQRMTGYASCLAETPYKKLKELTLRSATGARESVPAFEEVLEIIRRHISTQKESDFFLDIHIKSFDGIKGDFGKFEKCPVTKFAELTDKTIELVKKYGFEKITLITSFDDRVLAMAQKVAPEIRSGKIFFFVSGNGLSSAIANGVQTVVLNANQTPIELIEQAVKKGLKVLLWFNDNSSEDEVLSKINLKIDGVISNFPVTARQHR